MLAAKYEEMESTKTLNNLLKKNSTCFTLFSANENMDFLILQCIQDPETMKKQVAFLISKGRFLFPAYTQHTFIIC